MKFDRVFDRPNSVLNFKILLKFDAADFDDLNLSTTDKTSHKTHKTPKGLGFCRAKFEYLKILSRIKQILV